MYKESVCLGEPNQLRGWEFFKLGEIYCISIGLKGSLNGLGNIQAIWVYQVPSQVEDQDQLIGRGFNDRLGGVL